MHGGSGIPGHFLVLSTMITSLEVQGTLAAGSGVLPESGIRVWLCRQIGKPAAAMGLHGKTRHQWGKNMPLLDPWHREPTWGGIVTSCLLSRMWHGLTTLYLRMCLAGHILARPVCVSRVAPGGITGAEWLPAKRRLVKATLCTMMICHLLPGQTPDAGFNLP